MRVAIVGNSGSGKTTLACQLASQEQAAVLDLDTVAWEPNQIAVARPADLEVQDVSKFCRDHDSWVIEGCYAGLIAASFEFDPTLLVLDPGLEQCRSNCLARPFEPHKYASKDEQDEELSFLLEWVEGYYSREGDMSLDAHRRLFEEYVGAKRWLTTLPSPGFTIES